jgi:hypothetical protein
LKNAAAFSGELSLPATALAIQSSSDTPSCVASLCASFIVDTGRFKEKQILSIWLSCASG